jgi:carboxypeptidase C (cathepsin A)
MLITNFQATAKGTFFIINHPYLFYSADGLVFLKVLNAGHMVPMDQPANALFMLNTFLQNNPF